jgi:ribonuclease P protein component
LIWRIQDQATFGALQRRGTRARDGKIWITFLPDGAGDGSVPAATAAPGEPSRILEPGPRPPRVAFAIGRRVGHAVERNRLRRRLRAIFTDLARQDGGPLQPGAYLVGCQVGADGLTHEELREHVSRALTRINRVVAR